MICSSDTSNNLRANPTAAATVDQLVADPLFPKRPLPRIPAYLYNIESLAQSGDIISNILEATPAKNESTQSAAGSDQRLLFNNNVHDLSTITVSGDNQSVKPLIWSLHDLETMQSLLQHSAQISAARRGCAVALFTVSIADQAHANLQQRYSQLLQLENG